MLKYETLPKNHICYTHLDLGSGKLTHLSVTFLEELIHQSKGRHPLIVACHVPIDKEYAAYVKENAGLEPHRYNRITLDHVMQNPILLIEWDDGTVTIADGNHRYVKASELGRTSIKAFILKPELWKTAIVTGFPEPPCETVEEKAQLLKSAYSGIA